LTANKAQSSVLKVLRDRVLAALVRALGLLPFAAVGRLGAAAGRLLYRMQGREVRTARTNLAICFPDMDEEARERLVRQNLIETGRSLAQMVRVWVGPRLDLNTLVDENGFVAAGREMVGRGHGVIFALPHLGNWEICGDWVMQIAPVTALYRPPRQAFLNDIMRAGRARTGLRPVPTDRHGLKALHAALQRGEGVVILPDQVPKSAGASGVIAPFFGRDVLTMTLVGRLARRHGSPVLFCCATHDPAIGKHRIYHFEGEAAIGGDSPEASAAALNRGVERCARAFPVHYQWTYRRFEIPGSARPSPYR